MAKLNVFAWSNGLKTYALATTSRPKALAAWGVNQDLFKEGLAHETDDAALIAAATAQPDVAIEQPVSGGAAKALAAAKPRPKPKRSAAAKRVADLKAQLAALEADQVREAADLEAERRQIEARILKLRRSHEKSRDALAGRLRVAQAKLG